MLIVKGQYGLPVPKDVIPTSDMAGEIVELGEDVNPKQWKVGDRVSANFTQDHIDGDLTPEVQLTALGGQIDGCLTEYKSFPAYVSSSLILCVVLFFLLSDR